jgi:hypothetical protein
VKPALQWCRSQSPWDVVVSSSGPFTAHLVARSIRCDGLARLWIADFRDLWTRNHLYRGLFPFTVYERALERRILSSADIVTTVSDGVAATLRRQGRNQVEVIYNGFDITSDTSAESVDGSDALVRIVYTGTLYPKGQDPGPLLRALASILQSHSELAARTRLIVVGQGEAEWKQLVSQHHVERLVEIRGVVDHAQALRLQQQANALVFLDWNLPVEGVLTAKVFDYLRARAPILIIGGNSTSAASTLIARAERGKYFGNDESQITNAILQLVEGKTFLQGIANEQFISQYSRRNQSLQLLDKMRSALSQQ